MLQGGLCLCLLLPSQIDPMSGEFSLQLCCTWNTSPGRHFVDSSRMREPSGYSHISATSLRPNPSGIDFNLRTKIGPRIARSFSSSPSEVACAPFLG